MKRILLTFVGLCLAATPFAIAQEVTGSAAQKSEAEAAEPSASPADDTTVSVQSEKTASPTPKPASSPAPKPGGTPAATTKAASPAAASPAKKMSAEATLRDMENKWSASIPSRDLPVLQTLLAEDYAGVTSKGKVVNKRGLLAEVKKDTDTITSATNGKMDVRVFGNSAVVVGTSKEKGKDKEGKEFDRTYRWVDTWVERNGKWQCVASQAMQVQK